MLALAGLAVAIKFTDLTIVDVFASILVFVPTGWGILSVSLFTLVSSVSCLSSLSPCGYMFVTYTPLCGYY